MRNLGNESPSSNSEPLNPNSRDGTITDLEAAKLMLDAWKFRQDHAWSLLTRYFFAAVFVSVIPYTLRADLAYRLKQVVLVLPVLGGAIALAAVWLYAAEYIRAQSMNHGFRKLIQKYGYFELADLRGWDRVLKPRIGWSTVYILAVASILLSVINFIIVWKFMAVTQPG